MKEKYQRKWWDSRQIQFFGLTILFFIATTLSALGIFSTDSLIYFSNMMFFCMGVFLANN